MVKLKYEINSKTTLTPGLFWDTEVSQLEPRRHASFIMQRVLRWGNWQDWQAVKHYYGLAKVRRVWRSSRGLDSKSREFWRVVLNW